MTAASLPPVESSLIDAALRAALLAGYAIMQVYDSDDFDVEAKGDGSPLTRADKQAHAEIVDALEMTRIPVLSEEGKQLPYEQRKEWRTFWLVDPLDGTKEFIKRNGEFTVNIALVHEDMPVAGVVYAPAIQRLYLGAGPQRSYILDRVTVHGPSLTYEQMLEQATMLPREEPGRPYKVVGSRSHLSEETKAYVEQLKAQHPNLEMVSVGSSLKLCMVADGSADEYPRFGPTMEWDTAAAHAVCLGAGKHVLQWDQQAGRPGRPVVYNKQDLLNPWFIVRA